MSEYTFAVGDVHGCVTALKALIEKIERSRPSGTVVFLGDYVDRGPDSAGVIKILMDGPTKDGWKWVCLKGNHEDMMVGALDGSYDVEWWAGNGGDETLASCGGEVSEQHYEWAKSLPLLHQDEHRIFVHAGLDEGIPLDEQTEHALLWSRKPPEYSGEYFGKHLVHGHAPSLNNPKTVGNRTNVDSAAVFGGKLTAAVFADDTSGEPIEFIDVSCSEASS